MSRAMVEDLIAGNGRMTSDQEDAPDNPRASRIVEYINQGGSVAYGVVVETERDQFRYERETEYVRSPKLVWTLEDGRVAEMSA